MISLQDQAVKLWDARKLASPGEIQPLQIYEGHKEPVGGLTVHGNDVISWAGSSMGLISLQVIPDLSTAILHMSVSGTVLQRLKSHDSHGDCNQELQGILERLKEGCVNAGAKRWESHICPAIKHKGSQRKLSICVPFNAA